MCPGSDPSRLAALRRIRPADFVESWPAAIVVPHFVRPEPLRMTDVVAIAQRIQSESKTLQNVRAALQTVIVGQDALLDGLMIALLADGHVLLEGLPGLAKSLTVSSLA